MKILSIIPARGGSKGIPLKNLALIDGLTLLEYSINSSHDSKLINKTVVSTDNNLIAKEAKRLNAEVITRPKKISNDSATLEPTIKHTLDYLKKQKSYVPDLIVLLQNTSPLRTGKHIDEAIKLLQKGKYDSVFSGYFTKSLFWEKTRSGIFPKNYDPENRPRRQNMKNQIIENGAIYVTKFDSFESTGNYMTNKLGFYEMDVDLSYQVDTASDLFMIEQIIRKNRNYDETFSVKDKNIVITGSSGLLGSFYSEILLQSDANIALIDIDIDKSLLIKNKFSSTGQKIKVYKCDLTKPNQITATFKKIKNDFGTIDVLINNAAFASRQTFHIKNFKNYELHPFELWRNAFKVNIDAMHLCIQHVIPLMKKFGGSIINISSTYGVVGPDFDTYENEKLWTPPGYAVSKSAVLNLTRYVANLYGKYGIRCNTFTPSGVATKKLSKSFIKKYSKRNAFNRMAKPQDYKGAILFLCSNSSNYMTGANLIVDGGWTAR